MAAPGWSCLWRRSLSLSVAHSGKHNFRKFPVPNKRGSLAYRAKRVELGEADWRGRSAGYTEGEPGSLRFRFVPEMRPELIVPVAELATTQLRPYVSYRAPEVQQSTFTAKHLFHAVYGEKLAKDLREGKLDANGYSLEPSPEEQLTPEEARNNARKTGSDIFG